MVRWSMSLLLLASAFAADKYTGPMPPKPDLPYLVHASTLVPTEATEAKEETRKNDTVYSIPGANSPARTPLAEPILVMQSDRISAEQMELYKVDVKGGAREVSISSKKNKGSHPVHMNVTPLGNKLFRLEAGEPLDNGEYCLSPNDSNRVFCFEVY